MGDVFLRAKQLHVEALEPGLQVFSSVGEAQGAALAQQQHMASPSAFSQALPVVTLAAGALLGPVAAGASFAVQDTLVDEAAGGGMFDWLSNAWSSVTDWFGGSSSSVDLDLGGVGFDPGGEMIPGGGFGGATTWPEVSGEVWDRLPGLAVDVGQGILGDSGDVMPVMGSLPRAGGAIIGGAATMAGTAVGGLTLASVLGAGRAAATFTINGIRGTMPQLWKYTRRFGAPAVANALGITVGALGAMLLSAPDAGRRRRRRGISARDIRTTKRVVGFVSKMAHQIGCVRAPAHFRRARR